MHVLLLGLGWEVALNESPSEKEGKFAVTSFSHGFSA